MGPPRLANRSRADLLVCRYCQFGADERKHTHIWTNSQFLISGAKDMVCSKTTPCAKYRDHVSVRDGDTAETSEFPPKFAAWLALGINSSASKARGRQRSECA